MLHALAWLALAPAAHAAPLDCATLLSQWRGGTAVSTLVARVAREGVDAGTGRCLASAGAPTLLVKAAEGAEWLEDEAEPEEIAAPAAAPEPDPEPVAAEPMPAEAPSVARTRRRPARHPRPRPAAAHPPAVTAPTLPSHTLHTVRDEPAPEAPGGFVDTTVDPLSTFSVDVDTGSYTLTRRTLTDGALPPHDAVRTEEFVNYLPYEYARPEPGSPFAVDVELAPSPMRDDAWLLRVGVQAKKVAYDERKPVHLTFLVDTSGSMQSADKLGLVKQSLIALTEELEDGDTVSIVAYAGSAGLVLAPTSANDTTTITRALQQLTAGGSTAMGAGIQLAYAQAEAAYEPGAVNRVIIASDGDANVGATSHQSLSQYISSYAKKGITLTTLGFGTGNYRDTVMEQVANDGDGNYFYIDSEREARKVLVDKMTSTLEVVARDVKLQVELYPWAVESYRLIGYDNRAIADHDFDNDAVDAGEVGAGHQVTALYEVVWSGPPGELGQVHLRHKAPGPDAPSVERTFDIPWDDAVFELDDASPQLRMAAAAAVFAGVLKGSEQLDGADLDTAAALAAGAQRAEYPEDAELLELIGVARSLMEARTAQR